MPVVDADTHVDENEETWEYLAEADRRFRPVSVDLPDGILPEDVRLKRIWNIGGNFRGRRYRDDVRTGTTRETRELEDVPGRLRDMDRLGVDVQVIYPTVVNSFFTTLPEVELALCKSYNRWMADRTAQANGRLRWVAKLPMLSIDRAVEELRFAVDHGACGVAKTGIECPNRPASDPYFFPVYDEASRLNVPICFHIGVGDPSYTDLSPAWATMGAHALFAISAFTALVSKSVPDQFPKLRFGWIETSASWVPFLMHDMLAKRTRQTARAFDLKGELFRESRFYVTCDVLDDLPYILQYGVEDSLMVGSDYTHGDYSSVFDAVQSIRERGEKGEIPLAIAEKIINVNPTRFYGL